MEQKVKSLKTKVENDSKSQSYTIYIFRDFSHNDTICCGRRYSIYFADGTANSWKYGFCQFADKPDPVQFGADSELYICIQFVDEYDYKNSGLCVYSICDYSRSSSVEM